MNEESIDIEGFKKLCSALSKAIPRKRLNRVFEKMQVARPFQRLLTRPLNGLILTENEFIDLNMELAEISTSIDDNIERKEPLVAIYLYFLRIRSYDLYGEIVDKSWMRPRIRILAKSAEFDLELIDNCFIKA